MHHPEPPRARPLARSYRSHADRRRSHGSYCLRHTHAPSSDERPGRRPTPGGAGNHPAAIAAEKEAVQRDLDQSNGRIRIVTGSRCSGGQAGAP